MGYSVNGLPLGPALPTPQFVPLGAYTTVDATMGTMVAGGSPEDLDPGAHAQPGRVLSWSFVVLASVVSGETGTVELYDLTHAAVAATVSVTSSTAGTAHSEPVTLPTDPTAYELRVSCSGSVPSHYVVVDNASLKMSWS